MIDKMLCRRRRAGSQAALACQLLFLVFGGLIANSAAAQLPSGGSVSGVIALAGQQDSYTFSASAGESIHLRIVDTSGGDFYPRIDLHGPGGAYITYGAGYNVGYIAREIAQSGVHTVNVYDGSGAGDQTGGYQLHFVRMPGANEGGALPNGDSVSGQIEVGDLDSYTFNATQGESIALRIADTSDTSFYPTITLYRPDGPYVTYGAGYNTGYIFRSIDQSGTHTVVIYDGTNPGDQAGGYELHFARMPGANEEGALVSGSAVTGQIGLGDLDTYTFDGAVGESIALRIADTSDSSFYPQIYLYRPDGTYVTYGAGYNVGYIFRAIDQAGVHTVLVSDGTNPGDQTGDYQLHFARMPGANEGGTLVNGGSVSDQIGLGDLDTYTFDAAVGESIELRIADADGSAFYPQIYLYRPDGSYVTYGAGYNVGTISRAIDQDGVHTVLVSDGTNPGDQTGNYNLYFAQMPGANEGGLLAHGAQVADQIDLGDVDTYTFLAITGEVINVSVTDQSGGDLFPHVRLYRPDGSYVTYGGGYDVASFTRLIDQDGVHTILVVDGTNPGDQVGGYLLEFNVVEGLFSYAALGDSYSSGEGARPYMDPNDGLFDGCHRSTRAYATQVRLPFTSQPLAQRADVLLDFLACTGAKIENMPATGAGQYGEPPQLASVNRIDATRDLVTLSIGGNDAYWVYILAFCMAHDSCHEVRPFEPHSSLELGELFPLIAAVLELRLQSLFADIRGETPNAATLALGYPLLFGGSDCPAVQIPFASHLTMSESEQDWARDANAQINLAVQVAAGVAGLHFVPTAPHFDGHGVCGPEDDWIFGWRPLDPKASFHPTVRGQAEMAKVVNTYLELASIAWPFGYLANGLPRNPPPLLEPDAAPLAAGGPLPAFGALDVQLTSLPAACQLEGGVIVAGEAIAVSGQGFAPSEQVEITLKLASEPRLVLGTASADASGALAATVAIPSTVASGGSGTVEALAQGPDAAGLLLLSPVRVEAALDTDIDGDGIPDGCDNCIADANATQSDLDDDGIGDACDVCPEELIDDEDGDGLCASVDPCPADPDNDADGDGFCAALDNCATIPNVDQADADSDGIGDACEALACYSLALSVRAGGAGDVATAASNCGLDNYFDGTPLTVTASPRDGHQFTGWTGNIVSAANPLALTVASDTTLTANFCASSVDTDGDMVADACDNCTETPNGAQLDSDGDGFGNACDADFNQDCIVNVIDLGILKSAFFTADATVDLNGDGIVNVIDLGMLKARFFAAPGPSASGSCGP